MKSKPTLAQGRFDRAPGRSAWGPQPVSVPLGARCTLCGAPAIGGAEHDGRIIAVCLAHASGSWEMLLTPDLST